MSKGQKIILIVVIVMGVLVVTVGLFYFTTKNNRYGNVPDSNKCESDGTFYLDGAYVDCGSLLVTLRSRSADFLTSQYGLETVSQPMVDDTPDGGGRYSYVTVKVPNNKELYIANLLKKDSRVSEVQFDFVKSREKNQPR